MLLLPWHFNPASSRIAWVKEVHCLAVVLFMNLQFPPLGDNNDYTQLKYYK